MSAEKHRTPDEGIKAEPPAPRKSRPPKKRKTAAVQTPVVPAKPLPHAVEESEPTYHSPPAKAGDAEKLALQALVWSETPEKRFVVINGQIVKEGGAINGVVVKEIGWDYVELKEDQKLWRLKQ
jgi:hypothetical protein